VPENSFLYRFGNCQVRDWPYRHFYLEDCFPDEFYWEIVGNLPEPASMPQIGEVRGGGFLKRYKERFCFPVSNPRFVQNRMALDQAQFWTDFIGWLCSGRFAKVALDRLGIPKGEYKSDCYLVRDDRGYALGPHTDTPKKVVSIIFYLPDLNYDPRLGTGVYVPRDREFTDPKGGHLEREQFDLVATMPYRPNSCFGFARSDSSFHGVEKAEGTRWCLLFDIHAA
jgi:hypothetical protein